MCKGTGYVTVKKIVNELSYDFVYACDCRNGDNKLYDGSTIKDKEHRSNYYVPRYSAVLPQ